MLQSLLKNAWKSPGKILAICMVVYMASTSFFVLVGLLAFAAMTCRNHLRQQAKNLMSTDASHADGSATGETPSSPPEPVEDAPPATPTPVRRYAKSAVVVPLKKTGTKD